MDKELIIEIPYGGLGDHLFHSHLPRIAKETGKYQKVYISNKSLFRNPENKKLVWELNPFVDGFSESNGIAVDIKNIVGTINKESSENLLDRIMFAYGLDNNKRWNAPEVFYIPVFNDEYHFSIYDPNYLSWVGKITKEEAMFFFKKNKFSFEKIMKLRTEKVLYIASSKTQFIETKSIFDFCDLIFSSKKLFCLTSGTATLASALNKNATVFYGLNQKEGYQHSKIHKYIFISNNKIVNTLSKLKNIINGK